ncbi:MAG: NAD(P)H-dependent oxidoreductase [Myxococcota bacterium]|nr:NAD(P)H-dependent oxidoreductase [Myxococcota bacterium]
MRLVVVSGTNREGSYTLRMAQSLVVKYAELVDDVRLLDLRDLPQALLSPGAYATKPESFKSFIDAVLGADGLVVVTPEYNGSFPGVLKLFIDMLPFPESFENRPVCFVGLAAGRWGGLRPVEQLQQVFSYRNALCFNERVFLPAVHNETDDNMEPTTPLTKELLTSQIRNFVGFCRRNSCRD